MRSAVPTANLDPLAGPDGSEAAEPGEGEGAGTAGGGAGVAGRARVPKTSKLHAEHLPAPGRLQEEEGGLVQLRGRCH